MGFFRQESWSGSAFPSPGDLPDPGIELLSPALAGRSFIAESPGKTICKLMPVYIQCFLFQQSGLKVDELIFFQTE